jgi:hypothetical protein
MDDAVSWIPTESPIGTPRENADQDALEAHTSNRCFIFDNLWGVISAPSPRDAKSREYGRDPSGMVLDGFGWRKAIKSTTQVYLS